MDPDRLQISRALLTSMIFTSYKYVNCAHEQKTQWACFMHWVQALSIGVVTLANKKALFMTPVDRVHRFHAQWSQYFAEFDWFVVLMSRLDAYISRYGDFCAHDDDDDTTNYFTPCACARGKPITLPLAHARGVITGFSDLPASFFDFQLTF